RHSPPQTHQAIEGSRTAHGSAGILSDSHSGKVGRNACSGATGGTGRATPRIVGVANDTESGPKVSCSKLAHCGLAENDGSSFLHLRCDRGIPPRDEVFEDHGPVGRRHVGGFDLILEENRTAMQPAHGSRWALRLSRGVASFKDQNHGKHNVCYQYGVAHCSHTTSLFDGVIRFDFKEWMLAEAN